MLGVLRAAVFAVALLVAASESQAAGAGPTPSGFEVAFRSGVVLPFGNERTYAGIGGEDATSVKLSEHFGLQFPLWLDVGYRIDHVFVGAYGQYAFGLSSSGYCSAGYSCSANAVRVGFELRYHPFDWVAGQAPVGPWFGVGFGYEWATWNANATEAVPPTTTCCSRISNTLQGWDFVRLGFGGDLAVANRLLVGPFIECSLSQFEKVDYTLDSQTGSSGIGGKALHFWLVFGLKVTWLP